MGTVRSVDEWISTLKSQRRSRPSGWTTVEDLAQVELAIAAHPSSVDLWLLRGSWIQLCDDADHAPPLEEALRSYAKAAELGPDRPEPQLEMGHYLDAVADTPQAAIPFFERAIALGGGQKARDALAAARRQPGD